MDLVFLVFAMAFVTYVPRMIPLVILHNFKLPPKVKTFMELIPFAVLGALIIPGIFTSTNNFMSSFSGFVIAVLLAYCNANVILVILGAIIISYFTSFLI